MSDAANNDDLASAHGTILADHGARREVEAFAARPSNELALGSTDCPLRLVVEKLHRDIHGSRSKREGLAA
ncbi:hypothetical protein [Sinorhizobium psoraleae]|uniref:hypothetical protein n=1 Tax=Sinorhizobium psoraleae TaxID=520838 RepID=UPI00156A0613|nr:hypothetical protein [Sinorhizobium psoraleae]